MQYSFTCPVDGCSQKMTVNTSSQDEAIDQLTNIAKDHLASVHPEITKTNDEVRHDISSMIIPEEESTTHLSS